jgi:hypothetical protein
MVMVNLAWTGNVAAPQQGIFTHLEKKADFLQCSMITFSGDFTEIFNLFL